MRAIEGIRRAGKIGLAFIAGADCGSGAQAYVPSSLVPDQIAQALCSVGNGTKVPAVPDFDTTQIIWSPNILNEDLTLTGGYTGGGPEPAKVKWAAAYGNAFSPVSLSKFTEVTAKNTGSFYVGSGKDRKEVTVTFPQRNGSGPVYYECSTPK